MNIKKEEIIAYCTVAALFVAGVICYAFPEKQPDTPVRIMMDTAANATQGKVLFFHKEHSERKTYGLECIDCHHQWVKAKNGDILYLRSDDSTGKRPVACSECHPVEKAEDDNTKQSKLADDVHEGNKKSIRAILEEGLEPKLSDAIHQRCGGCHDDAGHGPGSKDCAGCHVL